MNFTVAQSALTVHISSYTPVLKYLNFFFLLHFRTPVRKRHWAYLQIENNN